MRREGAPVSEGDLFATLRAHAVAALRELHPELPAAVLSRVQMEPPRDATHGDMATNAAMVAAKPAGVKPQALAAVLAERLAALPAVASAAPAGPGFVNIRLRDAAWRAVVPAVLAAGEAYGDSTIGGGARIDVEYVSANPTGPMHVGHCRGAVVGDALASLLAKAGWAVTREYYVNDAGAQVEALGWAAYWRYLETLGEAEGDDEIAIDVEAVDPATGARTVVTTSGDWPPARMEAAFGISLQYGGDYLIPVGRELHRRVGRRWLPTQGGATDDDMVESARERGWNVRRAWIDEARNTAVAMMLDMIRADLAALGVKHDVFVSERVILAQGLLEKAEATLRAKDLIYVGVLEPPKGKVPDDWEPREQTLFRAQKFGDEVDRPLRKSDGSGTYFANDIANHLGKLDRGFAQLLHVWGADHGGYVKRMQAAVAALSDRTATLEVVLTQIVRVVKGGEPVRMSKRAGTYVALADLIDEVGRDAVRFTMLTRKADAQMEFDLDAVVAQTRENPVFYVQYAHARCRSVLRGWAAASGEPLDGVDAASSALAEAPLDALEDPAELALIRRLGAWPRTVEAAAQAREPHRIAFFLHDLAADFHLLWNRGREDATLRFIREDEPEATRARLALVAATATVIRSGLKVMGVTPVEEMR